jgi:hypothetical protein
MPCPKCRRTNSSYGKHEVTSRCLNVANVATRLGALSVGRLTCLRRPRPFLW